MKKSLIILVLLLGNWCYSQQDLIYLKDNTVLKGVVVNYNASDSLRFKTDWGGVVTVYMSTVEKIVINNVEPDTTLVEVKEKKSTFPAPVVVGVISKEEKERREKLILSAKSNQTGGVCFENKNNYPRDVEVINKSTKKAFALTLSAKAKSCSYDLPPGTYAFQAYSSNIRFNGRLITAQSDFKIIAGETNDIVLIVDNNL